MRRFPTTREAGRLVAAAVAVAALVGVAGPARAGSPYGDSTFIKSVNFQWSTLRKLATGSDNWPITWANDGNLYSTWGDGGGFGSKALSQAFVSIGVAKLRGSSASGVDGLNMIGGLRPSVAKCMDHNPPEMVDRDSRSVCRNVGLAGKSRGILALDSNLYMWVTPNRNTDGYRYGRLYKARIGSNDWSLASWTLDPNDALPLVFPTFLQAGKNNSGAGSYVYAYATRYGPRSTSRLDVQYGPDGGAVYLLRASRGSNLLNKGSWSYFAGTSGASARWTTNSRQAQPVFKDKNGAGPRVSAVYSPQMDRYFLMSGHTRDMAGNLGLFEGPNPWGPWKTVYYDVLGKGTSLPKTAFFYGFLPTGFSNGGRDFTFTFSGTEGLDSLNVVDGSFR